ncbi:hypothetical protein [Bordetella petrii]|uniref:hypothetical protein n=1 Tax=Bordetella petrii TaxID=94624 RepID=UPI001A967575|nr:hypothetical protein [Bordetella petrii]MBO1114775.1 hypothetical protein [Bordetella petrii]
MKAVRALWVGMLGAAIAMPAIAAGGKIHFTGSIVVPADCRTDVRVRGRLPTATLDCGGHGSAAAAHTAPAIPVADVAVRPLQARPGRQDGPRRYVIDVTYR